MDNKNRKTVVSVMNNIVSFALDKRSKLSEKKRRWYVIRNEGLEGAWLESSNRLISTARNLDIKCAHVISGAGDTSVFGAYCNNEELVQLLLMLGLEIEDVKIANFGEGKLFEHNLR